MLLNFPTICVDNFYKNPDKVREFALSLDYINEDNLLGDYPGKRTKLLHEVNQEFFDKFCNKLFSIYFDFQTEVRWNVSTSFQLIPPLAEEGDIKNTGWIHTDKEVLFGGIIYLTPDINPKCGTSIFKKVSDIAINDAVRIIETKKKFYRDGVSEGHDEAIVMNNKNFIETARFDNIYNRLVSFDGNAYHAANSFYTVGEPRLTQTFFVESIETSGGLPLQRCYNSDL